jgi:hypothetical protein
MTFVVPLQTSLSGGRVGHKGIDTITLATSGLKISVMNPEFHSHTSWSISIETVEESGITLGWDCNV